jgi:hypothetical protein
VAAGEYEVFVWWVKCWNNCASNAPYTVNYAGGSLTIPMDQGDRDRAGQWNSIGVFTFNAGTSGSVVLTNDADGRVIADAVRLLSAGPPVNQPPTVDAGPNQTLPYPDDSTNLDGTVGDDGLPDPPGAVTSLWTQESGPGTVTFGDDTAVDTTASFSEPGSYVLRLTADDSELSAYDEVTIIVPDAPVNQPPTVDAGPDQTLSYPDDSTNLDGTVGDDGLPNPPALVTSLWTQESGPGTVTFGDDSAVDTTASFSDAGTYVLRLTADDGELSAYDEVTIIVESSTPPTEIIIDNLDPGFSTEGSWSTLSNSALLHYSSDFAWSASGTGANRAVFTPDIAATGEYEVFVWWVKCWNNCASNAPYTVNHAGGSITIPMDQGDRDRAGQWNSIGVFTFNAGTSGSVVLTNDTDGRVVADAVRWVPEP